MPSKNKERIIKELDKTAQAILYVTIAMAAMEFAISYIGFTLSGVESSLIIATIIFVLAFIPSIGPIMVWAPLALYYFAIQQYYTALGIVTIGLILTVGIEQILYSKWIGNRTRIHPFVMLLGVIGGITLFGIFGFIFGPLILASALDVVKGAMQQE
ncbi:MAG TPA: AI-2E family transporter [Candidatus Diapherotrites archaeon]|uniref:AI-2E family transporter n=1 Tax=Candidatus Iainarchaeum sp. TaxID=3101447 RepID=A0A7J4IWU4_9ARCH|nr:AI-2E family transporter [Candidatus Diapherotrites archaeon]